MRRRLLLALSGAAMLGGAAIAERPMRLSPNPSAVVAAEIGFNQLAQDKGQWTAFRETAAKDAIMFVPQAINAKTWLKGRADPPRSVKWQPQKIFLSCDGGTGVTTGAWQRPDGSQGYFTTIWRRDEKGRWNWILDHGDALAVPRGESDMIASSIAKCRRGPGRSGGPPRPPAPPAAGGTPAVAPEMPAGISGSAPDGSLYWRWTVAADGGREVQVGLWNGEGFDTVIDDRVAAPGG